MYVRFRKHNTRLQVSIVASQRIGSNVSHRHLASLGSVADPPSVLDRRDFWLRFYELRGQPPFNGTDLGRLVAAMQQRIPMLLSDEQLDLYDAEQRKILSEDIRLKDRQTINEPGLMKIINRALQSGLEKEVCNALSDAIRKQNVSALSAKCGVSRTTLYRAFQPHGHPDFSTVVKVLKALNLQVECYPAQPGKQDMFATLNKEIKTENFESVYVAFCELLSEQANISFFSQRLAMTRTSLYRWLRSGKSPTLLSVLNLSAELHLHLRVGPHSE